MHREVCKQLGMMLSYDQGFDLFKDVYKHKIFHKALMDKRLEGSRIVRVGNRRWSVNAVHAFMTVTYDVVRARR